MGKQRTIRQILKTLRKEGFIPSPNHGRGTSHQRWIHKEDPTRYADVSSHSTGDVVAKGTLKSMERTSGVEF